MIGIATSVLSDAAFADQEHQADVRARVQIEVAQEPHLVGGGFVEEGRHLHRGRRSTEPQPSHPQGPRLYGMLAGRCCQEPSQRQRRPSTYL